MATKIRKFKVVKPTLKAVQAQFAAYKVNALALINKFRYAGAETFFSVKGYEKVEGKLKPNVINVPELLAIVGTAKRLGKLVVLTTSGVEDGGQVNVLLQDDPSRVVIPSELTY
jgi:hypothetical protein